ncbi:DUF565 domain-containing protein [Cyanobium sp. Aljojuca 7A6]|nr:DUF565 domain-containing protein [Cyanobium sp. La Preciosa 7G6]MCP9938569.1 DUF565 domain-containing protein [Cyanobium sp. Aljojuca 7A6]
MVSPLLPFPNSGRVPPLSPRFQQTRFQQRITQSGNLLEAWAQNPWRRLSLLLIVLLSGFVVGGGIGSITGALSLFDPLSALICVVAIELAARLRGRLLAQPLKLRLQVLDMARMGLLYGLLLDGFKLL